MNPADASLWQRRPAARAGAALWAWLLFRRARARTTGWACGLAAFVLYVVTLSPGVEWQDSGVHQYRIIVGVLENPLGLALTHPLHYWLGRAALWIPFGEPTWRLNLLSAFAGASAVGLLAALAAQLTRRNAAALVAAASLAVAHIFWQMSVTTETYTLAAALMVGEWLLAWRYLRTREPWWLMAVFLVNGLHVANHLLGLLTLAVYAVLILERVARRRIEASWLLPALVAWLLGARPYWTLVLGACVRSGDVAGTLNSALFGAGPQGRGYAAEVLNTRFSLKLLTNTLLFVGYNFPAPTVLLALWGPGRLKSGAAATFRNLLAAQSAIILLFVARYSIADQLTFFVPVCVVVALWLALGFDCVLRRVTARRGVALACAMALGLLWTVGVYLVFPPLARSRGWLAAQMRVIPYRDPYEHFLRPWRVGNRSGARFAEAALDAAGPGGYLLANNTVGYMTAAYYASHRDPPGVQIFSFDRSLTEPDQPPLTAGEIVEHIRENGVVVAAPFETIIDFWPRLFTYDRSREFWRVGAVGAE
jgi:hypothetical protein